MSNTDDTGRLHLGSLNNLASHETTDADAAALAAGMEHRQQSALATYRAMKATGELATSRLVEYRCRAHRCLLLDVFPTPEGPALYWPTFRFSPARNGHTDEAARRANASDGDRRWHERAELMFSAFTYLVACDHVLDHKLPNRRLKKDMATRPTTPILLPDQPNALN